MEHRIICVRREEKGNISARVIDRNAGMASMERWKEILRIEDIFMTPGLPILFVHTSLEI